MAEELELQEDNENINNRSEERIKELSSKVREKAQETAAERKLREEAEAKALEASKERDFYKEFTTLAGKYQAAPEYQEKIWEKVKAGYTTEDAAVAVLNAEGKLTPPPPPPPPPPAPAAGGSAVVHLPELANKSLKDMNRDEKRAALVDAFNRGDITID